MYALLQLIIAVSFSDWGDGRVVSDLPRDSHPAVIGAGTVVVMLFGALFAMGVGMLDPIAEIVST